MLRGPYRHSLAPSADDERCLPDRDEVVSYVLLAGAGGLPVAGALAHHETFHTEATIGLFMLMAGALGLVAAARAAWRARRARRAARE